MHIQHPLIGIDKVNKVALVYGNAITTLEDYKIIRLTSFIRAFIDRTQKYRPLVFGVSVGNISITAGTLGYYVLYQGENVLLSNAHVFTDNPASPDPPSHKEIIQPGSYDNGTIADVIGYYIKHTPISLISQSSCPISKLFTVTYNSLASLLKRKTRLYAMSYEQNVADAAICSVTTDWSPVLLDDDGSKITPNKVVGLLFAGSDTDGIYICCKAKNIEDKLGVTFTTDIYEPNVGDTVHKIGRTTGHTVGQVVSTNMTLNVMYEQGIAQFTDVIVVQAKSAGGDSGSLVYV